ncbi:branched chain amino acid aminotransferase [Candidatus Marinamargulisbacteria bacterium SCGC AG-410-N11]|nr:branched chain amino acid aminotransferase [Candidatus Marinamargulisbacteria bacterium SCGC AG-410-N11]
MKPTAYIWKNGDFINWEDATTHVLTHALHYGSGVFEGIRAYSTPKGPAIFRAREHYDRLINSGKLVQMQVPYSSDIFIEATSQLIEKNNLESCYIRPLVYCGYGSMGLKPPTSPIDSVIAAWEWGSYLGEEGLEKGIRCKISSWRRIDSQIVPPLSKCTANYSNSSLAKMEAINCGYDEAILLNLNGYIGEGPGENIFLVKDNVLYTPPASDHALSGITAQTIIELAKYFNIPFEYKHIIRDELFLADELFFTGTAAEVTPIREVDDRIIGNGGRGTITEKLQTAYFNIVKGMDPNFDHWLSYTKSSVLK